MEKIEIVTFEQIEEEEDLWRTMHEMLTLAEKIVISKLGDFDNLNFKKLLEIKEFLSIARIKALDNWKGVNDIIKYSETGTDKNQS